MSTCPVVLPCVAVRCRMLQCVTVCCSVVGRGIHMAHMCVGNMITRSVALQLCFMKCVAECCSVLQCCGAWHSHGTYVGG